MTLPPSGTPQTPRLVLHLGAHRTGTTSVQTYLHENRRALSEKGIGYWGPAALRQGRFPGLFRAFDPAGAPEKQVQESRETIAANLEILHSRAANQQKNGHHSLIVSDENLLGDMQINLMRASLYPDATQRMAVVAGVFGAHCRRITLTIRRQETYWPSLIAYRLAHGAAAPKPERLEALARQKTGWRAVIETVQRHFPEAELQVLEFDGWAERPDLLVSQILGQDTGLPPLQALPRKNAALNRPALKALAIERGDRVSARYIGGQSGLYQPFSAPQLQQLEQQYRADLAWLTQETGGEITFLPKHFG